MLQIVHNSCIILLGCNALGHPALLVGVGEDQAVLQLKVRLDVDARHDDAAEPELVLDLAPDCTAVDVVEVLAERCCIGRAGITPPPRADNGAGLLKSKGEEYVDGRNQGLGTHDVSAGKVLETVLETEVEGSAETVPLL